MVLFSRRLAVLILGLSLGVDLFARQHAPVPEAVPLSTAILAKLPQDWRDLAGHVKATDRPPSSRPFRRALRRTHNPYERRSVHSVGSAALFWKSVLSATSVRW